SYFVMFVTYKKSEMAILRNLGASPSMITKIFMVQCTVIGVLGTVAGTVLGVILALTIIDIISWFNNVLGLNLFYDYFVHYLPYYLR
ncbi:FtsX-like permease family protein, partial [Acinetobacter baumannii]|uniref:FtsX-like permease family protein n=1 Tax=Acinetobacter baumannii TaxID=470 RepID=UPI003AF55D4F